MENTREKEKARAKSSLPAALDTAGHSGTHYQSYIITQPLALPGPQLPLLLSFLLITTQLIFWPLLGCLCPLFRLLLEAIALLIPDGGAVLLHSDQFKVDS